ncbi:MAG: SufS family cysteine desulfurase [Planctomycetota bacterium]|nr:SufS family cysteine desulfurase [Planctomycetota bacterium]MDA1212351.1 SufS family cysteine desulfurase [Planctomycetota bacterium]
MTATLRPTWTAETIRRDFPILEKRLPNGQPLVYLDNAATSQKPQVVINAVRDCYETYYSNVHRGVHQLGDRVTEELEGSRAKIQKFVGANEPEEIIFTSGTTMSINLVANGWGRRFLSEGDEVLVTEMEHHANLVPWQQIVREKNARLRYIPITAEGRLDKEQLESLIGPRTKMIAVTTMSNVLGTINDIHALSEAASSCGARLLVDAAQSVAHMPTNVLSPRVDFLAFSGHKIYGPSGIGVLYGRRELLEAMDPFLCGGNMISEVHRDESTWGELPAKFEAGTLPIAPAIGLGTAIDYVQQLGWQEIHDVETTLTRRAWDVLTEIPGLHIVGPPADERGSIISFTVDRLHPHDLATLVDQKGVAIRAGHHCTMPLHDVLQMIATARASFAVYNTLEEVDILADAIRHARKVMRLS